ncbi:prolyl oligopeptidase family serine peptidase [Treponema phagedenis]|uniref:alpha/beta hydrolase family protein n=1 Tax=Treponema phagedenis TaxID=162 RepID=UPI0011E74B04|nr:prolyl oligopeptidase family serine peptidase [Treponema phagedenis]QEJ96070.1 prolyl oligopeptidase family serine peptidase [Treponema phagedenis]
MSIYTNQNIIEEKIVINGIPCLRFYPSETSGFAQPFPSIIYYHGWSSEKNKQRILGYVFANLGYQILVADAMHHGERDRFKNYDETLNNFFLPTIMQNLAEFPILQKYLIDNCKADKNRIAVAGHSMGGYTTAGIFTHNHTVKTALVFNGACNWQGAVRETEEKYKDRGVHIVFDAAARQADPANNIEKIINRPLFLLHGMSDSFVSYKVQKQFYDTLQPKYADTSKIKLMSIERMDHYISIQMLDEAIDWLQKEFLQDG